MCAWLIEPRASVICIKFRLHRFGRGQFLFKRLHVCLYILVLNLDFLHFILYCFCLAFIQSCFKTELPGCRIFEICIRANEGCKSNIKIVRIDHRCIMACHPTGLFYPVLLFTIPLIDSGDHIIAVIPCQNFSPALHPIWWCLWKTHRSIWSLMIHIHRCFCCPDSCDIFQIRRPFDRYIIWHRKLSVGITRILNALFARLFSDLIDPFQCRICTCQIATFQSNQNTVLLHGIRLCKRMILKCFHCRHLRDFLLYLRSKCRNSCCSCQYRHTEY